MPCKAQLLREFYRILHDLAHLVRHFQHVQHGQRYLLEPSQLDSLGFSFLFVSPDKLTQTYSFVNVLEECNPVVLILILTLVLVGWLQPELLVAKPILLAFLLSIRHLQNYSILE